MNKLECWQIIQLACYRLSGSVQPIGIYWRLVVDWKENTTHTWSPTLCFYCRYCFINNNAISPSFPVPGSSSHSLRKNLRWTQKRNSPNSCLLLLFCEVDTSRIFQYFPGPISVNGPSRLQLLIKGVNPLIIIGLTLLINSINPLIYYLFVYLFMNRVKCLMRVK